MHIQIYIHIIFNYCKKCCYIATFIVFCTKYLYLRLFSFAKIPLAKRTPEAEATNSFRITVDTRIVTRKQSSHHQRDLVLNCYYSRLSLCVLLAARMFSGDSEINSEASSTDRGRESERERERMRENVRECEKRETKESTA